MLSNEAENYVGWTLNDAFKGTIRINLMRSYLAENKSFWRIYNCNEIMNYEKYSFNTSDDNFYIS